ncbi:hypothetical protein D3C80_536070 [compost metagenome]
MDRFSNGADRLRETGFVVVARHITGLEMHLSHPHIVAGNEAVEDFGKEAAFLFAKASGNAHIDGNDLALSIHEEIAGMHVGVEEAIAQRMPQEGLDQRIGELVQVVAGGLQALDIRHLDTVNPFHGDDIATGALPIHLRNTETRIVLGIFGKFGKGGGL